MATPNTVRQEIITFLKESLLGDADRAIAYLKGKGFCLNGQIVIASLFVFARDRGVSVETVIAEADKEWARNWLYQSPEIRGSLDAPGAAGMQNRASLENLYSALGIPSPARA